MNQDKRNLPIFREKERIIQSVRSNPVTIIIGDTGCGKSTQLPQFILDDYMKKKAANLPLPSTRPPHIVIAEVHTAPLSQV